MQRSFLLPQRRLALNNRSSCRSLASAAVNHATGKIQTAKSSYQVVVGLEIHAQLDVATKLFSPSSNDSIRAAPNTNIHPFDVSIPGILPLLNQTAVHKAVLAAAALECEIAPISRFERKHYVYADLPHGYQITQQRWPLARNGQVALDDKRKTRIERVQIEMDTAKTTGHRIDFNRAGCPLIEIVTDPDIFSAKTAAQVVTTIRSLLQHTGSCDGRMEHGHFRVDCNINIKESSRDDNKKTLTPRVEVKNLNSVVQVQDAIQYEAQRQTAALEKGEPLHSETRTWNAALQETQVLRRKDQADDYRFLPEPDLPPLHLDVATLDSPDLKTFLRDNLAELPATIQARLGKILPAALARQLSQDPHAVRLFDQALVYTSNAKVLANIICNELTALIDTGESMAACKLTAKQVGELVDMLDRQIVSKTMAKNLLEILYCEEAAHADPATVASERGFELIADTESLRIMCLDVIAQHPEELLVYKRGGKFVWKMEKLFTGKVMQSSRNNAHPERLQEVVKDCLKEASVT